MRPIRTPVFRTLVVATSVAVLVGACSGSFSTNSEPASGSWPRTTTTEARGDAVARVAASSDATAAERTARFAYSVEGSGAGERTTVVATGAVDFETHDLSIRMDISRFGLGVPVDGSTEVRVVDGVLYVDLGDLGDLGELGDVASELPDGIRWLRLDLGELADALGAPGGLTDPPDPLGGLDTLRSLSSDVDEIGPEVLRGVETTHYRATLELPSVEGDAPVDVWLDAQGRVRKYTMRVGDSSDASVAVTYELYDFGAPVEVGAPPADEVGGIGSILGGLFDRFLDELTGSSTDSA